MCVGVVAGEGAVAGEVGCLFVACAVVGGRAVVSVGDVGSADTSIGGMACGGGGKSFGCETIGAESVGVDGVDACTVVRDRIAAQPITTSNAMTPPKIAIEAGEDRRGNAACSAAGSSVGFGSL